MGVLIEAYNVLHKKKNCTYCGCIMDQTHDGDVCECCLDDLYESDPGEDENY